MEDCLPADILTLPEVLAINKAKHLFYLDIRTYNKKVSFSDEAAYIFLGIAVSAVLTINAERLVIACLNYVIYIFCCSAKK
ncbi:hypothetical protein KIS4809_2350 [Bacillus sp. ZZV12-4809]|nr:hypothetical protein KIS4809_2350 [Bacillus sp. ZZV12-4809]